MRRRLSIVIPVYNARGFVDACLETLSRQGLEPGTWEAIAVDDGSTDGSLQALEERAQALPWLRVVSQENAGAGAARNRGMDEAQGEYLYFFDVDDGLKDGALRALSDRCAAERLDVLFFGGALSYESPEVEREHPQDPRYFERRQSPGVVDGGTMLVAQQAEGNYCGQPCLLMARADFLREEGVRFAEGIVNEDNLYVMQATLRARRADVDPKAYYVYNVREGSVTTAKARGEKTFVAHLVLGQEFEWERLAALRAGRRDVADAIGKLTGWYEDVVMESCPPDVGSVEGLGQGPSRYAGFAARLAHRARAEADARRAERERAEQAERRAEELQARLDEVTSSASWKAGRALTALPRAAKDALGR